MVKRRLAIAALLFVSAVSTGNGQRAAVTAKEAAPFMGTWVLTMTEPPEFKGQQTVRIWEQNGNLAASLQSGTFPANEVTGIHKDGNMLVLSISRDAPRPVLENGAPIWSVITLTLDGDSMKMALTLEKSVTIKRGTGKKQQE